MQQRYYDPVIGRFYSNDPVSFSASDPMLFNRYAYANNNPYKFVDPDGRAVVHWGLTGGASAGPSASAATGRFVEITSSGIRAGTYSSGELGASTSIPSADAGIEIGAMTGKYESALQGPYMLAGAEGVATIGGSIAGVTTLSDSPDVGLQVSLMLGTPQLGGFQHTGFGTATETFSLTVDDVGKAMEKISSKLGEMKESFNKTLEELK
ncbi:RHS repeat-associated core domain-containing protein [Rheinheimera mesophila]|uniref:RHS repeat-associated core domain-containing protein n=1 Tax=Rheinheimera mesophila TaxID=1547515 RepID=UPI00069A6038|nr:RHS repeat-associated core domain-containing protein [Rheinheimera mesophila]